MTKHIIRNTTKAILADRGYLGLVVAIIVIALVYILFVVTSVEGRDIQVVTQYSAFGESHFYKSHWFYLYTFALLGALVAIINVALMGKLLHYERRSIGVAIGWLTIVFYVVAAVVVHSVLRLAFL